MRLAFQPDGRVLSGYHPSLNGLADSSDLQSAEQIAAAGLSTSLGIMGALTAVTTVGLATGIGAAVAGAAAMAMLLYKEFQGCGQTCIFASEIADKIEPVLRKNVQNYLDAPVHYASLQAAALNNFDFAWAALVKACSNTQLQDAGQRCIGDRQDGACHYHTSPGGWANGIYTAPGADGSGTACWNWFVGYRSPIASDPTVVPDPVSSAVDVQNPLTGAGGVNATPPGSGGSLPSSNSPLPLFLAGGAVIAALYFMGGMGK